MRNIDGSRIVARRSYHLCEYCSNAYKYRCYDLQYLHKSKEVIMSIKKDRHNSSKVIGLF